MTYATEEEMRVVLDRSRPCAQSIFQWLRTRNGGELNAAIGAMSLQSFELALEELALIITHGGRPPNWVPFSDSSDSSDLSSAAARINRYLYSQLEAMTIEARQANERANKSDATLGRTLAKVRSLAEVWEARRAHHPQNSDEWAQANGQCARELRESFGLEEVKP